MMDYILVAMFVPVLCVIIFFWYTLYGRGLLLVRKLGECFPDRTNLKMYPSDTFKSKYFERFGGTVVLFFQTSKYTVLLHWRQLIEALKHHWLLVIECKSEAENGFYGRGLIAEEMRSDTSIEIKGKSALSNHDGILSSSDFVEVNEGRALCFIEIGSVFGSRAIPKCSRVLSS